MSKKKDPIGSILFRLFFAAVFFGGDAVQFLGLGEEGDPTAYLMILGGVIVLIAVVMRSMRFLKNFDMSSISGTETITNNISSSQNSGSNNYTVTEKAQTVTGEVVNPHSVSGK